MNVPLATPTQQTTADKTALVSGAAVPSWIAVVSVLAEPLAISPISTSTAMAGASGLLGWMRAVSVRVERLGLWPNLRVTAAANVMGFISSTNAVRVCGWPTRAHATAPVYGVEMQSWMTVAAAPADIWSCHTTSAPTWTRTAREYAVVMRSKTLAGIAAGRGPPSCQTHIETIVASVLGKARAKFGMRTKTALVSASVRRSTMTVECAPVGPRGKLRMQPRAAMEFATVVRLTAQVSSASSPAERASARSLSRQPGPSLVSHSSFASWWFVHACERPDRSLR